MKRIETPEQRLNNLAREYYHSMEHNIRWQDLREEDQQKWVEIIICDNCIWRTKKCANNKCTNWDGRRTIIEFGELGCEFFEGRTRARRDFMKKWQESNHSWEDIKRENDL